MMFNKEVLANGLRIITVPMKATRTASVLVLVGTGSKYETKQINGISHFLEHMFFKGTKKRPNTLAISEALDRVGGEYNAFTGQEYTGYWAKVDAGHLDLALDWVSDIFLNSQLKQTEIDRERGVILEEIHLHQDMPMSHVHDLWLKVLYGQQPAGWPVIGRKEVISRLQRKDFLEYRQKHYSAPNTVIALAGKFPLKQAAAKIKRYFQTINTQATGSKPAVKEEQSEPAALIHYKKTDQTHLSLGCRAYNLFHPDRYALALLATILGGSMSSRLFIAIRERQGLAYYIRANAQLNPETGFLAVQAGLDNQRIEKAIKGILQELKRIAQEGVSAKELQKAKDYTKGTTLLDMEASDAQASFVAFQELLTKEILTLEEKFSRIEAVKRKDIQRVAEDIFQPAKLNLALIGPFRDKKFFEDLLKANF